MTLTPEQLVHQLLTTASAIQSHGDTTWQRTHDWQRFILPSRGERGGGLPEDAVLDDQLADRQEDRQASRYHTELLALIHRIHTDTSRLQRLQGIANPPTPRTIKNRDLMAAQVAADGYCLSCWRNNQHLTPIETRPNGEPYYRDRCRWCGEYKAAHRDDPPLEYLRLRHAGRRILLRSP